MRKSQFYPFIAGIYDFYFASLLLGAIVALGVSIVQVPINLAIGLTILGLSLLAPIAYHVFWAKQFQWLSPGEILVGRFIQNKQKLWTNPYGHNRWALFLIILLTLLIVGNTWDRLIESYVYSLTEVVIRIAILALVLYGLVEVGRGRTRGIIYPILYYVFQAFQATNSSIPGATPEGLQSFAFILIGTALLNLIVVSIYGFLRSRHKRKVVEASG